jgi:hypothetical protein
MALSGFDEIKNQVLEEWTYFADDSERAISEMADFLTPHYYNEIIQEWCALSSDDSNRFDEVGVPADFTIEKLMAIDLWIYYENAVRVTYEQVLEERVV